MSRKAERITPKDFSHRDATSSGVIPFVSIFGRIFNLMVPAQVESEAGTGVQTLPVATTTTTKQKERD